MLCTEKTCRTMKILLYLLLLRALSIFPFAIEPVPASSQPGELPSNPSFTIAGAPSIDPELRARVIQDNRKDTTSPEVINKGIGEKIDDKDFNVDPAFPESLPQFVPPNEPKTGQPAQSDAETAKANIEQTNANINQEQEKANDNEKLQPSDAQNAQLTPAGAQVLDPDLIAKVKQDSAPKDLTPVVVNAEAVKEPEPVDSTPQQPDKNVNRPTVPEPLPEPVPQKEPKPTQPLKSEENLEQAKASLTKVNVNPGNEDTAQPDANTNANLKRVKVKKVPTQINSEQRKQDNPAPNLQTVIIPPALPHFMPLSDAELLLRQSLPELLMTIVDTPAQLIPKENLQPVIPAEFVFQSVLQPGLSEAIFRPVNLPREGDAPLAHNAPQEPIREDVRTDIPKTPSERRPSVPSAWPNRVDSMDSRDNANPSPTYPKILLRPQALEKSSLERHPELKNDEVVQPLKPQEPLQPMKPSFPPQQQSVPASIGLFPFLNCFLAPNVDKKLFLRYFEQLGQAEAASMPEANPGMLLQMPMQLEPILSRLQTQHPEHFRQLVQQWQANPALLQNVQQDPDSYLRLFHENPEFVINPQLAVNVFVRRFELLQLLEILRNATWLKEVLVQSPEALTLALQNPQAMVPEVMKLGENPEHGPRAKELLRNNPNLLRLLLNDRHLFMCLEFFPPATLQMLQIMNANPPLLQSSLRDPKMAVELCDKLGENSNLFQRIQENPAVVSEIIGAKWQQPEIVNRDPVVVCYLNA